jgi:hypothetical protein
MGEQLLGSPRPGHGRVFVNCIRQGEWWASWQDDYPYDEIRDGEPDAGVEDFEGTEDEVISWARTRPAEKFFIFSDEANAYLPLEPAEAAELPAAAEHRQRVEEAVPGRRASPRGAACPRPRTPPARAVSGCCRRFWESRQEVRSGNREQT